MSEILVSDDEHQNSRVLIGSTAVIGVPNAGKSSLLNALLGTKLSICLLYTSPSPRDKRQSRMPSSA